MRTRKLVSIVLVIAAIAVVAFLLAEVALPTRASTPSGSLAPNFTLTDIYGHPFTLSSYRNSSVVVIEFTALSCSACQIVEQKLSTIYSGYNQTGTSVVRVISIYIEPQFGDTIPALRAYHAKNNITWTMAQDTNSLAVSGSYGVKDIPTVVVINKAGQPVYEDSGVQSQQQLQATISGALAGTATPISIVTVSVFALAAIAGVSTFFSPCAFPMFPGYMGLFLGLNTKGPGAGGESSGPSYQGAARKALVAGSATAAGMLIVIMVIAAALLLAARAVNPLIPDLLFGVGVVLIGLGALLFTNLQYWRVVTPFQRLWSRLRGKDPNAAPEAITAASGNALYLKLFGYGMGYAAAAAGCVAPVIFGAISSSLALGLVSGLISILIFGLTAALLMIGVTVLLSLGGKRFVNQLKAYTPIIKKVSAGALVIVGVYLIYFYYTAWGL